MNIYFLGISSKSNHSIELLGIIGENEIYDLQKGPSPSS